MTTHEQKALESLAKLLESGQHLISVERKEAAEAIRRLAPMEAELAALKASLRGLEPVAWQHRWTNPGDNPEATEADMAWKPIETWNRLQTLEQRIEELQAHRYNGKPCYEVRAVYTLPPNLKG